MIYVSAAVIIRARTVLLTRRKAGQSMAGFWEFPGGKIETGETPQACLERELQEELGLETKAAEVIAFTTYRYAHATIRLIGIRTYILSGQPVLRVHDRAEWTAIRHLQHRRLAPADLPIAQEVERRFSG